MSAECSIAHDDSSLGHEMKHLICCASSGRAWTASGPAFWGIAMNGKTYRAYLLIDNRVVDYAQFSASDDTASIHKADEVLAASDNAAAIEIWRGERKVALRGRDAL